LIELAEVATFAQFCAAETGVRLIFSERGGSRLADIPHADSVTLAVGPEGGWSARELALAEANGFLPVHLGNRILRTETAAVAAVALAQYAFGDFG
jgi:16S rRNA (uracil1498-N3)-methyltransferase